MDKTKKFAIFGTLILLLVVAGEIAWRIHQRHVAENTPAATDDAPNYKMTEDDNVYLKREHQMSMKDARELNGKRLWISAGGQMTAYAATPTSVNWSKEEGLLLGAEPIDVVNFIEGPASKVSQQRIPAGDRQAFMLFHRASDPKTLLGIPVGYREEGVWKFFLDDILFYQDPHILYKHWGQKIWEAVDAHKVIPGMNELQTQIALGQVSTPGGGDQGNRTVTYFNNNHPVTVTFSNNKATSIQGQ